MSLAVRAAFLFDARAFRFSFSIFFCRRCFRSEIERLTRNFVEANDSFMVRILTLANERRVIS